MKNYPTKILTWTRATLASLYESLLEGSLKSPRLAGLLAFVLVASLPLVSWAAGDGKLINPLKGEKNLWQLVEWLVRDILVGIIAPIAVTLALLWSGFQFIMAQGNSDKLAKARTNFLYVIIGAILLLGAYVILSIVTNTVGELTGK